MTEVKIIKGITGIVKATYEFFDEFGYNEEGYNIDGYNKKGYNKYGISPKGFDKNHNSRVVGVVDNETGIVTINGKKFKEIK